MNDIEIKIIVKQYTGYFWFRILDTNGVIFGEGRAQTYQLAFLIASKLLTELLEKGSF